jgi:hypothetical protein
MLKLLLDEHISPGVANGLRRHAKGLFVCPLNEWEGGRLLGLPDEVLLKSAALQGFTLVTYDRRTIPPLLKVWAEEGRDHGGVVFVDNRTIPSSDVGGLVKALQSLWKQAAKWDWTNRTVIMRR